jgi:hypothetical protein
MGWRNHDEKLLLPGGQAAGVRAACCRLPGWSMRAGQQPGRQPGRGADPRHRRLDLRFPVPGAGVTPLRVLGGTAALARFRRMLGLFVYFYACCTC